MRRVFFLFTLTALLWAPIRYSPPLARGYSTLPQENKLDNSIWVEVRADANYLPARIAPSSGFLDPQSANATFTVNYLPSGTYYGDTCIPWPNNAKAAFTYAANIWASYLNSAVPIVIDACWATNLDAGVLGHSGAVTFRRNFTNAPQSDVWYPAALANALYGSDLDPASADIFIAYNYNFAWYFGLDGATPSDRYDFASVVLHEIAHGLGFIGSMSYGTTACGASNYGCWGMGTAYASAYDTFMQNGSWNYLLNTALFPNYSAALGSQLTGNNLYFNGDHAKAANGGNRPKMYAPSIWMQGSSFSHLDYDTFKNTSHRLMVYAISPGASIHDPGTITLGILQDLGWKRSGAAATKKLYLPITLKPQAGPDPGYWRTAGGSRYFYVSTDRANVNLYTIFITLSGGACSGQTWRIWKTASLPISNNQFSFSGALNGNGTFLSATTATVTDRITNLSIEGCGTFNGGPWTNSFTWQNSSQPASFLSEEGEETLEAMDEDFPAVEVFYSP